MGFYQPSQLIQDAQRHGVRVLPADVSVSNWDCALELLKPSPPNTFGGEGWLRGRRFSSRTSPDFANARRNIDTPSSASANLGAAPSPQPSPPTALGERENFALRLGLRQVSGLSKNLALRLTAARGEKSFDSVADMTRRAHVNVGERARLADAGALRSLSGHRHRARWDSAGAELPLPVLANASVHEEKVALRPPSLREDVMTDYSTQGLSLTLHPLALIRPALARRRVVPARVTTDAANQGRRLRCAGLVTVRQHPGTAKGVTFVTLEDETGHVNVVVWRAVAEKQHRVLLESSVMCVEGTLQASEGVHHLIADRLFDYSALLPELSFASRDFH